MAPASSSKDPRGYPVLVYIHGGGFCYGDAIILGYKKITNNFVSRGLVFVTLPYRVGIYGLFFQITVKVDISIEIIIELFRILLS